ncbi:MAG: two-component regulator propeller domain-containing protein [Candidatus Acidiferrum sp.]
MSAGSRPAVRMRVLLLVCAALICGQTAFALEPSLDISQYAHSAWFFRNGFLNGAVYAIAQTPDGYLWLGTQSGVVRFDGARAVPLALPPGQQLPSTAVTSLLAARDGTLWIGTFDGLASWKDGRLTEYPALAQRSVIALFEDRDGTMWAGGFGGPTGKLCAIRDGRTTCFGEDGRLGAVVTSLYEDSDGSLWVAAATGLWRWKPGPPARFPTARIPSFQAFAQGDDGSGVILALDSVRQIVGGKLIDYPLPGSPLPLTAAHLLRDRSRGLWIGTSAHGLVHSYQGKTSVFAHSDGLSGDRVIALFEDREGTLWVATSDGLDQFREAPVGSLSVREQLSSATATSILAARDGSIWIGTEDGLNRWKQGRITVYRKRTHPGLPDDAVQSLFEDERGRIWVSGYLGLAVLEGAKFTLVPSVPPGTTHAIAGDKHGGLWLSLWVTSNDSGLMHLADGKIIEQISWQKIGGGPGSGLVPDQDGGVWTGLISGGIAYWRSGQIRNLPLSEDPAGSPRVLELRPDRDGSLWAATENGLFRITNGRVAALTTANGLPCNAVHWIIEDDLSSYWLYTRCGLLRIARSELAAWTADPKRTIQVTTFDVADGIRPVAVLKGFRPSVTKSSDGKIWFLNGDVISVLDPSRIRINTLPPPVRIEQMVADHKIYWRNSTSDAVISNLRLPARIRDLQIDYTALSLVAPEKVHFKYMLEGQDQDWKEVINDRQAQYTNLPPRHYRFRVIASNNSGVWNEQGDVLDFSIAPAYYQTNWFRGLCVAAVLALLWALYQLRLRQMAAQFNMRLEERVGERTRIARDLHDTLLQSFHGILLHFQTGINLLPERRGEAQKTLEKAMDQARHAIVEGREAIQGLRSSVVETNDLAVAMRTLGEELAANANSVDFQVHVEGTSRDLHPILRDEVYRITGEGIRNAFRHAEAKQIEVEIHYDDRRLRVRVRDDGKGMDPKLLSDDSREGHFGLRGMRERAKLIGGKLTVWSELDAGTEVELSIPAARAYTTATDGQQMSLTEKVLAKLSGRGTMKKP